MGDDPPHGTGPGDFPEQGGPSSEKKTYVAALGRKLGVTPLKEMIEEEIWELSLKVVEAYFLRRKTKVIQCY